VPMNVQPIPNVSDRINEIRRATAEIVNRDILPNEHVLRGWREGGLDESARAESRALRLAIQ